MSVENSDFSFSFPNIILIFYAIFRFSSRGLQPKNAL